MTDEEAIQIEEHEGNMKMVTNVAGRCEIDAEQTLQGYLDDNPKVSENR